MEKPGITTEGAGIYPERISSESYLDGQIDVVKDALEGKGYIELSSEERDKLLAEEKLLGTELESFYEIGPRVVSLYISYLKSEEGRQKLLEITGIDPPVEEDLRRFMWEHIEDIKKIKPGERTKLAAASTKFEDKQRFESLIKNADDEGKLSIENLEVSEGIYLGLDPEKSLAKIQGFRSIKKKIKLNLLNISRQPEQSKLDQARRLIFEMYLSKVNTLIAEFEGPRLSLREKARLLGADSLLEEERILLKMTESEDFIDIPDEEAQRKASRYDKFLYGAAKVGDENNKDGWQTQISQDLRDYIKEMEHKWYQSQVDKNEILIRNGFDPKKLQIRNISPQTVKENVERILAGIGILSDNEEYDFEREGNAKDNGWQVQIRPGSRTFSVSSKKKTYFIPDADLSKFKEFSVGYGHELRHVIQNENRTKIPLRIFEKVGGGRSEPIAEAGSMDIETLISEKLFGVETVPHPHYIMGMIRKMENGNYLDVVKVIYEGQIAPQLELKKKGEITKEDFENEKVRVLKLALSMAKRIFKGSRFNARTDSLPYSKDMVYLEQTILTKKLKEARLDFAFDLIGVSLENMARLIKLGLLDPTEIKQVDTTFPEKLWQEQKSEYLVID